MYIPNFSFLFLENNWEGDNWCGQLFTWNNIRRKWMRRTLFFKYFLLQFPIQIKLITQIKKVDFQRGYNCRFYVAHLVRFTKFVACLAKSVPNLIELQFGVRTLTAKHYWQGGSVTQIWKHILYIKIETESVVVVWQAIQRPKRLQLHLRQIKKNMLLPWTRII